MIVLRRWGLQKMVKRMTGVRFLEENTANAGGDNSKECTNKLSINTNLSCHSRTKHVAVGFPLWDAAPTILGSCRDIVTNYRED